MSQERTRFPIQPKDVRRTAKSNRDIAVDGGGRQGGGRGSPDKPLLPPHRRHEADEVADPDAEAADDGGAEASDPAPAADADVADD